MKRFFLIKCNGQSLVELLVIAGLAAIFLPALLTGLVAARDGKAQERQRLQATAYLQEAQEATRNVREKGWDTFAVDGTFHPVASSSAWTLASGSETINGFTRQIVVSDVNRDTSGAIVASPSGTLDPSTKKVVVTVSWTQPYSSNLSSTLYLTRHDNLAHQETLAADFNPGTKTNTYVTTTQGGEISLGAGGGGGDWCIPSKSITQQDLPKSGVANAVTAIEGRVFAGTGDNASGVSFADVQLTTNIDPPQVTGSKSFDGYKTNAVFGESNYAYLATDNNAKEVVMIDLTQYSDPPTNSKYKEAGYIDLPGNGNADSVYVLNNKAYVSGGGKLYIYSLAADRTTATLQNTGGYSLSGTAKKVFVTPGGQYAYVVTSATTNNFEIINVTNSSSPTRVSIKTIGSSQAGVDVFVSPTDSLAYVALAYASGKNNVYKIDISNLANPQIGAGYSTSGMSPKGITAVSGNRVIVVGTGGTYQYQVLNSNTMALCSATSELQYATGVNGVAGILQSNGYAYSYIITGDAAAELKIILGGAGGQYVSNGTFESATFDPGFTTAFNRIVATVNQPAQTSIKMQVAVAKPVNGSCTGASFTTYLGPDGTTATYFTPGSDPTTIDGQIPLVTTGSYANPGRCFRYKATLQTNDSTQTPEIDDVTVNYSP